MPGTSATSTPDHQRHSEGERERARIDRRLHVARQGAVRHERDDAAEAPGREDRAERAGRKRKHE